MPETLQTDRLALLLLRPEHLDVVHTLFSSGGHTIGDGPVRNRADTASWLARRQMSFRMRGLAWYGLWDANKVFLGSCGAFIGERCGDEPEIGYEIGIAHRGHGFAKEAAHAVTDATHNAGHDHLWATIRPSNLASARILRSTGYKLVRTRPDAKGALDYYLSSGGRRVTSKSG